MGNSPLKGLHWHHFLFLLLQMKSVSTIKKEWRTRTYRKPKRKETEIIYTLITQVEPLLILVYSGCIYHRCILHIFFFNWDAVRLFYNLFFSINKMVHLPMSIHIDLYHHFNGCIDISYVPIFHCYIEFKLWTTQELRALTPIQSNICI